MVFKGNLSSNSKLDGHLLPGLNPLGVPKEMQGLTHTFSYGDKEELSNIVNTYDVGTIIMEPLRGEKISEEFLFEVRKICDKKKIVLIFDEVTSGFREYIGGHHMLTNINPDIALFGKTISNGIPMAAIIGKKEVMKMAEDTFISSTYWTDRSGPAAAVATIKNEKNEFPTKTQKDRERNQRVLTYAAKVNDLNIKLYGSVCLTSFELEVKNWQNSLTLYTQEMLKLGILASDRVYSNMGHNYRSINYFKKCLIKVLLLSKMLIKTIQHFHV